MALWEVESKVVMVTGAASGIGLSVAEGFLREGAKVVVIIDVSHDASRVLGRLQQEHGPGRVVLHEGDVCDHAFIDAVYDKVTSQYGAVDVLVNNAGIVDEIDWKRCVDVNISAVIAWTYKYFHHMRRDKGGKGGTIINTSSIFGFRVNEFCPIYQTSKFAVFGFSKSLGHENNHAHYGVRVLALCPGYTTTSLTSEPKVWKEEPRFSDFQQSMKSVKWQSAEAVGDATVAIYRKAESGSAWLIEDGQLSQVNSS